MESVEFLTITTVAILTILLLAVYGAAMVTYHIVGSDCFELRQKIAIVLIAWLIPIIGPAFILTVLRSDKLIDKKPKNSLLDLLFLTGMLTATINSSNEIDRYSTSDFNGNSSAGIDDT